MPKAIFWIILSFLLFIASYLIVIRGLIPKENASVRFKEPIEFKQANGDLKKVDELSGEVTKRDRYIVVKTENNNDAKWIYHGREITGHYKTLHVYAERDGRWRLVAVQSCPYT